jgi:hypothetical protein
VKVPDRFIKMRQAIPVSEISYGVGGIKLFSADEIEDGQMGYGVALDGASLSSDDEGAWQPSWIAIGFETACGDPLFIETADPALPVLTAMHGEGAWKSTPVAISFEAFAQLFREFAALAKGRSNPVELDGHPLSQEERTAFLHRVDELNEKEFESSFWAVLTEG